MQNKKQNKNIFGFTQGERIFIAMIIIIVFTFVIILFNTEMYVYDQEIKQKEYLNGCMGDYSLQIKLLNVETGNRNINFTYEWGGEDNSSIFLIASKYRPFSFTRDNVKYNLSSDFRYFESIPLNKGDIITLNHIIYNFDEFNNWDGEEILILQKANDKNCVKKIQAGVYFINYEYTDEEEDGHTIEIRVNDTMPNLCNDTDDCGRTTTIKFKEDDE